MDANTLYILWQQAYELTCHRRRKAHHNSDIWSLRFGWHDQSQEIFHNVLNGKYFLSPMLSRGYDSPMTWCSQDAVVLKFLALYLRSRLPVHHRCCHLKGGTRKSVRDVNRHLSAGNLSYVFRTDIRGFYEHIQKSALLDLGEKYIQRLPLRMLYEQYVWYSTETGGEIRTPEKGICRGSALSPLVGAALLYEIDDYFGNKCHAGFWYTRYMDDFLILSDRRWPVRRSISWLSQQLDLSGFTTHPDKTVIGSIQQGFDWLGVWFCPEGNRIAPRALENYRMRREEKKRRCQNRQLTNQRTAEVLMQYDKNWTRWASTMLNM